MTLALTADHRELAEQLRAWAESLDGPAHVRAAEGDAGAAFDDVWARVADQQVATIGLSEAAGGGGGSLLDAAVALESAARAMVPGSLLGTTFAALAADQAPELAKAVAAGARVAVAYGGVVVDASGADWLLAAGDEHWWAVPAGGFRVEPVEGLDLSRRFGSAEVDLGSVGVLALPSLTDEVATRTLVALAAAEASGVARWCLDTAVAHAKVREQFGQPIGRFQAVKQLCAGMLETAEAVSSAAWDCAAAEGAEQAAFAAEVAGTLCFDGAVRVAQDCIQVLGGIGFTFEHDAHLHLRRAMALRNLAGGSDRHADALARRAQAGVRRRVTIDLGERGEAIRRETAERVAELVDLPADEQRAALAREGLLQPHWPAPYGRDADPVEQLAIGEALAEAGVALPDIKIGAWAIPTILEHGSDEQRERLVWPTLLGEVSWCQLFSEPGAGSDLASLRTRAERVEAAPGQAAGWRLTGQKVWTSLAREADWGICLARTGPADSRHHGITYFLVDMSAPGIEIRPLREMTGDAMFNEVFLDDVFVPDDQVVGEVDGGWRLARTTLANERVAMAGTRLGASTERAVSLLGSAAGPSERVRVGRAVALATVCGLLDVRTTLRSLAGQGPGPESSVAKLLTVRNRQDASELVVDLHGSAGLLGAEEVREDVHEMLLTRCLSIAGGTTQILRNVAAERILGLPR